MRCIRSCEAPFNWSGSFGSQQSSQQNNNLLDVNQTDSNGQIQTGPTEDAQYLAYAHVGAAAFHQKPPFDKA